MRGVLTALVLMSSGCGCPASACRGEPLATSTPGTPDQLSNSSLSVCVNSYCAMGTFGTVAPDATYAGLVLDGGCISVAASPATAMVDLTFALLDGSACPPTTLSAGDVVHARLVGMDGVVIFDKTHVIELQASDSCGGKCDRLELFF